MTDLKVANAIENLHFELRSDIKNMETLVDAVLTNETKDRKKIICEIDAKYGFLIRKLERLDNVMDNIEYLKKFLGEA